MRFTVLIDILIVEVRVYDSQGPLLDSFKLVNEEARKASSPDKQKSILGQSESGRYRW